MAGEQIILRDTDPFGTTRLHLTIETGQIACIEGTSTDDVTVTYRSGAPGAGGSWAPLPEEETIYSGDLTVVATSVQPDGSFSLEVTKVTEEEDCETDEPDDTGDTADPPDLVGPELCGPSDFLRFLDQLAEWFQEILGEAN